MSLSQWQHGHDFCGEFSIAEKNTRRVLALTATMISVVAHRAKTPAAHKQLLREHEELVHVTIEVNLCPDGDSLPAGNAN